MQVGCLLGDVDRETQRARAGGGAGLRLSDGRRWFNARRWLRLPHAAHGADTVDNCWSARGLVTADGRLVRASSEENQDLFWGLRKLVREAKGAAPLSPNAKTPLDGLQLPETVRAKLSAPTYENKPLAESYNNRGAVLVSLINARKRGVFAPSSDTAQAERQRFSMMNQRLDKAIAIASGASLNLNTDTVLIPGLKEKMSAALANSGDSEIQIKQLDIDVNGKSRSVETAEKLLPATDTTVETDVLVPGTERLSVPSSEHLYDGRLLEIR